MRYLRFASLLYSVFFVSHLFAQGGAEDTMRAGSGGSAGATGQSPVYDGGVLGPNGPMGAPDVTAVDPNGNAYKRRKPSKTPVGTIRVEGVAEPTPPESSTTR